MLKPCRGVFLYAFLLEGNRVVWVHMITKKTLFFAGILALVVIGLISWGINTKAPQVSVVSPEALSDMFTPSATGEATTPAPKHSPDRAVAPKTQELSTPTPKKIVLDLSSEFARTYEAKLTPFLERPADFNKHYVVARWSCGSGCVRTAIVDKNNGRAYLAPSDVYGSLTPAPFTPYTLESDLFRVVNDEVIDVYRFESGRFLLENIEEL